MHPAAGDGPGLRHARRPATSSWIWPALPVSRLPPPVRRPLTSALAPRPVGPVRQTPAPDTPPDDFWKETLRAGGSWADYPPSRAGGSDTALGSAYWLAEAAPAANSRLPRDAAALWLWPSVFLFDGRTANRGWMQEAPDPTTHTVWGSWVDIHPAKAKTLGIADGDILELSSKAGKVEAPARVTEDVHEQAVALAFGQGHTALGRNAKDRGANAFSSAEPGRAGRRSAWSRSGRPAAGPSPSWPPPACRTSTAARSSSGLTPRNWPP